MLSKLLNVTGLRLFVFLLKWSVIVAALKLSPRESFADFFALLSLSEILRVVADLGAEGFIFARLRRAADRYSHVALTLVIGRLLLAAMISAIYGAALLFSPYSDYAAVALLPICWVISSTAIGLLEHDNPRIRRALFLSLLVSGLAILLAARHLDLTRYLALFYLLPDLIVSSVLVVVAAKPLRRLAASCFRHGGKLRVLKRLFALRRLIGSLISLSLIVVLYSRLDVTLVRPVFGEIVQGAYSKAFRITEPIVLLFSLVSSSLLLHFSAASRQQLDAVSRKLLYSIGRTVKYALLAIAALSIAATVWYSSRHLLSLNDTEALAAAALALSIPFRAYNILVNSLLQRHAQYALIRRASLINLVLTFLLAGMMGNRFGIAGIAVAAATGEIVNLWFQETYLRRHARRIPG